jgi:MFS transporter, MHS family, proline/betaine transporter
VTTILDQSAVASWGWRVPFLIGLTIGIFGLYIRRHMIEDEVIQSEHAHLASPLREAFRTEWRTIVRLIALGAVGAVGFYMSFVYITTYLRQTPSQRQWSNWCRCAFDALCFPSGTTQGWRFLAV